MYLFYISEKYLKKRTQTFILIDSKRIVNSRQRSTDDFGPPRIRVANFFEIHDRRSQFDRLAFIALVLLSRQAFIALHALATVCRVLDRRRVSRVGYYALVEFPRATKRIEITRWITRVERVLGVAEQMRDQCQEHEGRWLAGRHGGMWLTERCQIRWNPRHTFRE